MRLLELFCGTRSIGKAFEQEGFEVLSLDLDPKTGADIICDLMDWDYTMYPRGYFDVLWASPPCTMHSRARTTASTPRDLEGSDNLVQRVLDLIEYFQPKVYAFENPGTGLLPTRKVVGGIPYKDISYCMYNYPYRKYTRIWTDSKVWEPRPKCTKQNPCEGMRDGRHQLSAQRGPAKTGGVRIRGDKCSLYQLYSMPAELCSEMAQAFKREV